MATTAKLDADELLHLSMRASKENRHEDAIGYLKQALELAPKNGKIHYMLGAEHAEIGLYERAAEEMAKAVALDPNLVTAHFQLGLLHITSARVAEAEAAWKPLDKLGPNNPLFLFKSGLLHLARDEFDECAAALEKGIGLNRANEPLNNDMRRVLNDVRSKLGTPAPKGEDKIDAKTPASGKKVPKHVAISAYRENKEDKD